jgi:hypothetical protein
MGRVADLARNTMHMMMWEKVKMYIALFILTLTAGITGYVLLDHLADSYRAQSAAAVEVILDAYSNWRYFVVRGSDQIITDTGDLEPLHIVDPSARFASVHGKKDLKEIYHTDLPDAGWKGREFDDSSWPRSQTDIGYAFRLGRYQDYQPGYFSAPFICMRGKFMVEDPERMGDMFLSADFNGGVVVYINGKEAGRAYMPEGEIEWQTPAEEYPSKAYFTPDNNPLEHKYRSPDAMRLPERFNMRTRRIRHLRIPSTLDNALQGNKCHCDWESQSPGSGLLSEQKTASRLWFSKKESLEQDRHPEYQPFWGKGLCSTRHQEERGPSYMEPSCGFPCICYSLRRSERAIEAGQDIRCAQWLLFRSVCH